jgi:hypothetical protein
MKLKGMHREREEHGERNRGRKEKRREEDLCHMSLFVSFFEIPSAFHTHTHTHKCTYTHTPLKE